MSVWRVQPKVGEGKKSPRAKSHKPTYYRGSHKWGTPIAGWFRREKPIYKWMITRGTSILGNPHILVSSALKEKKMQGDSQSDMQRDKMSFQPLKVPKMYERSKNV